MRSVISTPQRGRVTGEQLTSLLHPAVTDLDLADCSIRHHHLAALAAACTNLRCGEENRADC